MNWEYFENEFPKALTPENYDRPEEELFRYVLGENFPWRNIPLYQDFVDHDVWAKLMSEITFPDITGAKREECITDDRLPYVKYTGQNKETNTRIGIVDTTNVSDPKEDQIVFWAALLENESNYLAIMTCGGHISIFSNHAHIQDTSGSFEGSVVQIKTGDVCWLSTAFKERIYDAYDYFVLHAEECNPPVEPLSTQM